MELLLGIIIFALIGFIAWREKHFANERHDLIAALLSRDATEYKITSTPATQEREIVTPATPSPFIDEHALSDDEWFEAIKKTNEAN